jgi:hypothetical protein
MLGLQLPIAAKAHHAMSPPLCPHFPTRHSLVSSVHTVILGSYLPDCRTHQAEGVQEQ